MTLNSVRGARACAAAALLVVLILLTVATGVSQQAFEYVRAPQDYADLLRDQASGLRVIVAVDAVFILCYTAFGLLLGAVLRERADERSRALAPIVAGGAPRPIR